MRLFLSSENLGNHPQVFQELVGGSRLAYIENAKDDLSDEDRVKKSDEHKQQLKAIGFKPEEIDLRDYFDNAAKLEEKLEEFDGLFVYGGNTFILRRAFAYSGLDRILKNCLRDNTLAYGGSSAGSIIITPSLRGSEKGDLPGAIPRGYKPGIIWDGLGLVDFHIVPHYDSDWWGKEALSMENYLKGQGLPYKNLHDGQVIVINNKEVKLLQ